jgi:hypothetical protein
MVGTQNISLELICGLAILNDKGSSAPASDLQHQESQLMSHFIDICDLLSAEQDGRKHRFRLVPRRSMRFRNQALSFTIPTAHR